MQYSYATLAFKPLNILNPILILFGELFISIRISIKNSNATFLYYSSFSVGFSTTYLGVFQSVDTVNNDNGAHIH